ncbi:MAG: ABC transporter permease subunit [Oscillospiraceae bacterium]
MINIIKSLNYQVRRDNFTIYGFLIGLLFMMIIFLDNSMMAEVNGGSFVAGIGEIQVFSIMVYTLIISTRICGWDYADKTINYEILSGHKRSDVYFSRVIAALAWAVIGSMVICILPVIAITLVKSWGYNMDFGGAVKRYALMIFPVLRLVCEFIFITFAVKNFLGAAVCGFIGFYLSEILALMIEEFMDYKLSYEFSGHNIVKLFKFNSSMGYADGKDITVYSTEISQSFVTGTVVISLVIGTVLICLGYALFRKSDMK